MPATLHAQHPSGSAGHPPKLRTRNQLRTQHQNTLAAMQASCCNASLMFLQNMRPCAPYNDRLQVQLLSQVLLVKQAAGPKQPLAVACCSYCTKTCTDAVTDAPPARLWRTRPGRDDALRLLATEASAHEAAAQKSRCCQCSRVHNSVGNTCAPWVSRIVAVAKGMPVDNKSAQCVMHVCE